MDGINLEPRDMTDPAATRSHIIRATAELIRICMLIPLKPNSENQDHQQDAIEHLRDAQHSIKEIK